MVWPVKAGTRITAAFRQTSSTNWKTCGYHTGTDFGSFDGDPIYAVVAGNVWRRDYGPAFGITCAVSPDTPGEWQYSHLQSIDVPNGAWVEAGDRIATSGRSGGVDPHVHIEWHPNHKGEWRCGIQADPIAELNRLNATTPTYPTPTSNKVYLSKLKYGQKDSDSVWYLQRALGMAKEYWTGFYGPLTDDKVRAHQAKHLPPADPEKASWVGSKQAALLFGSGSGITVVDDLPKEPEPEPEPSYPTPTSGKVYLSKLKFGQKDSDSVWYLQRALGLAKEHWVGTYGDITDDAVRSHQQDRIPPADEVGKSSVGPMQAELLFGNDPSITVIDDRDVKDEPNPRPLEGLRGIDISSHQAGIDLSKVPGDFVILKTTEGSAWPSNGSAEQIEYKRQFEQTKAAGKLVGLYHFARNDTVGTIDDAIQEADWFIQSVKFLGADDGQTVLVLDWERQPYDDVDWAVAWLNRVYDVLGVRAMIYMNEYCANLTDWSPVSANHALWVAKYVNTDPPPGYDPSQSAWPKVHPSYWPDGYAIWQWTSRGDLPGYNGWLDLNASDLTKEDWAALAASDKPKEGDQVTKEEYEALKLQVEKNTAAIAALRSSFVEFQKGQTTKNIEVSKLFENLSAVFLED